MTLVSRELNSFENFAPLFPGFLGDLSRARVSLQHLDHEEYT